MSVAALALGAATGFLGAIPPGPSSMAVASHAAEGRATRAVLVGLGAATVDLVLCAAIAMGAGPTLARWTEPPAVRLFLAVAYASLGALLLAEALLRPRRKSLPGPVRMDGYARGVLRGLTNPTVAANWTFVITAMSAAGLLSPTRASGALFALGVGLGVSGWFATLAHLVERARGERLTPWMRGVGAVTGLLLLAGGSLSALRALTG